MQPTVEEAVDKTIREHVAQVDPFASIERWSEMFKHLSLDALDLYEIQYELNDLFDIDLSCIEQTDTVADVVKRVEECIAARTENK